MRMLVFHGHVFIRGWFYRNFDVLMKILVTDGEGRSSLAVTRSLGRKGHIVFVTGNSNRTLASSSRFCQQGVAVADPLLNSDEYAKAIYDFSFRKGIQVILPMTEQSIYLLNPVRKSLPDTVVLACAEMEKMKAVSDKVSLYRLAERLGIAMPQTFYLNNSDELSLIKQSITEFPVVIKPALSRIAVGEGFLSTSISYATDIEELEEQYKTNPALQYPSMIQEKIIGPGTGLFTLYDSNQHLALFSHRRLLEKPPSGGVSVVSESVPLDEEMVEAAGKLLSSVGWQGVAMVEFKRDERDGKAKLMEINGRFWGTLQLAITCGVDFPCLFLETLQGKKVNHQVGNYTVGHRMKWFFGTIDHLLIRLKNSDIELHLPPGTPSKWRAVGEFANLWSKTSSYDVFNTKDMKPFSYEARSYFFQFFRGR